MKDKNKNLKLVVDNSDIDHPITREEKIHSIITQILTILSIPEINRGVITQECIPLISSQLDLPYKTDKEKLDYVFNEMMLVNSIQFNKHQVMKIYNNNNLNDGQKLDDIINMFVGADRQKMNDNEATIFTNLLIIFITIANI